jgi:hypothetical protein
MLKLLKSLSKLMLAVGMLLTVQQSACAQFGGNRIQRPFDRPTISPYLNLARGNGGGSSILNYYGLVRPQQEAYRQNRDLNRNLREFEQDVRSTDSGNGRRLKSPHLPWTTGHRTSFMTIGGGSGSGRGSSGGGGSDDSGSSGSSGHNVGFGNGAGFAGSIQSSSRFGSGN